MSQLGHLDRIDAYAFAHYLCLTGVGSNPTLGWSNWFEPIHALPNTYAFRQEPPPACTVLPVVMPMHVLGVFAAEGAEEVSVRHLVEGRPAEVRVPLRPISRLEEEAIARLMSASALCYLRNRGSEGRLPAAGSSFSLRLGSVDIPFACGKWNDPARARRYDIRLTVEALLPCPADIEAAVRGCFAQGSVAAALAALLTPAGWGGGLGDFQDAVESGLLALLGDRLVNVTVSAASRCLDGTVPRFAAPLDRLPLPSAC